MESVPAPRAIAGFHRTAGRAEGERVYAIQENVQRRVSLALRGMPVSRIRILPQKNWGASYIAIHEVALLIDVKARDYTG